MSNRILICRLSDIFTLPVYFGSTEEQVEEESLWVLASNLRMQKPDEPIYREQNCHWLLASLALGVIDRMYIVDGYNEELYYKFMGIMNHVGEAHGMQNFTENKLHKKITYIQAHKPTKYNNEINGILQNHEGADIVNLAESGKLFTDWIVERYPKFAEEWKEYLENVEKMRKQREQQRAMQEQMRQQYASMQSDDGDIKLN